MRMLILATLAMTAGVASAQEIVSPSRPAICSMDDLLRMNKCELLALYTDAAPGPIPHGYTPGKAIFNPGRPHLTAARANLMSHTLWQGKIFLDDGHLINKVFGKEAVNAEVYRGESWYDGKPSIMIDYQNTSKLFSRYRDEIREVAPGLYLGLTHERRCPQPELKMFFALDARCP
jgi:hypothetical protein